MFLGHCPLRGNCVRINRCGGGCLSVCISYTAQRSEEHLVVCTTKWLESVPFLITELHQTDTNGLIHTSTPQYKKKLSNSYSFGILSNLSLKLYIFF